MSTPPRVPRREPQTPRRIRGPRSPNLFSRGPLLMSHPIENLQNGTNSNNTFNTLPIIPTIRNNPTQPRFEVEYRSLPIVTVEAHSIEVFDLLMHETTNVNPNDLDKDLLYFKSNESYFSYPSENINNDLENNKNIFFKCTREIDGAPRAENIVFDKPYYLLRLNGNFLVSYSDIYNALNNGDIFELKKVGHATHVASYESVIKNTNANGYPLSFTGEQVNIVSADHCQDGSAREIYTLKIVHFTKPPRRSTRLALKTPKKGGTKKVRQNRKNKTRKSLL